MARHTICWKCKTACTGQCQWMERKQPIPGWIAEPTTIVSSTTSKGETVSTCINSFCVLQCPNFKPEKKK